MVRKPAGHEPGQGHDQILPFTRAVAFLVIPFLVAAFLILYVDGRHTAAWFAWEIPSRLTTALMGAGYLGGAYFFWRVGFGRQWHRVHAGYAPVTAFTIFMLLATLLHLDAFLTGNWPFWVWLALYVVTPLLVPLTWWRNRPADPRLPEPDALLVPAPLRRGMAVAGIILLLACLVAFIWPNLLIPLWPWTLSPLTARVMAGWHAVLGVGALALAREPHWSAWPVPMQSIALWQALVLIAAWPQRAEFGAAGLLNGYVIFVVAGLAGLLLVATLVPARVLERVA